MHIQFLARVYNVSRVLNLFSGILKILGKIPKVTLKIPCLNVYGNIRESSTSPQKVATTVGWHLHQTTDS